MVDERLTAFIKKERESGSSESEIKKKLKAAKWSESAISEGLSHPTAVHVDATVRKKEYNNNKFIGFFSKLWSILAKPKKLFEDVKEEAFKNPVIFFSIIFGIVVFLTLIIATFTIDASLFGTAEFGYTLLYLLLFVLLAYLFLALYILVTYGLVKLFKGEGSFTDTTKAILYGTTPSLILAWIPYVQYGAWVWSIVLQGYGLAKLHELKWWKALLVILIPVILVILAVYLMYVYGWMAAGTI